MTTDEKRAQGRRNKRRGGHNERRARDYLYQIGATRVVKSGASLGEFDLVAFFPGEVVLVQVKSNTWPGPQERANMRAVLNYTYVKKIMLRWDDRAREPQLRDRKSVV